MKIFFQQKTLFFPFCGLMFSVKWQKMIEMFCLQYIVLNLFWDIRNIKIFSIGGVGFDSGPHRFIYRDVKNGVMIKQRLCNQKAGCPMDRDHKG